MAAALVRGDAVSDFTLALRDALAGAGVPGRIFAGHSNLGAEPLADLPGEVPGDNLVVYHHSTGCDAAGRFAALRGGRRIVVFHNITPPAFLADIPHMAARTNLGLAQLGALAKAADLAVGVSELNAGELRGRGFPRVVCAPLFLSDAHAGRIASAAGRRPGNRTDPSRMRLLSVARVVPHKRLDVAIQALALLRRAHPGARLRVVGERGDAAGYAEALHGYAKDLCGDAVEFLGRVSEDALADEFSAADVLLHASAHEGFCVPVIEAMLAGVPVVAVDAGAVAATAGGAALLVPSHDPAMLAESVCALADRPRLRADLVRRGREVARRHTAPVAAPAWLRALGLE